MGKLFDRFVASMYYAGNFANEDPRIIQEAINRFVNDRQMEPDVNRPPRVPERGEDFIKRRIAESLLEELPFNPSGSFGGKFQGQGIGI